jgi:hypothetical protein
MIDLEMLSRLTVSLVERPLSRPWPMCPLAKQSAWQSIGQAWLYALPIN